jgi:hypothetical protein
MNDSVKNIWKPLCIVFAALLALSWVFFGFLYSKGGVNFSTLKNPEQNYTANGGGMLVGESTGNGAQIMSVQIPAENYAEYGISAMAETAYLLTATITPESATNKAVDWSVAFVNPASEWATGKTVTDYVIVTPTSDGALTANVECKKAFGEQIKVTVTSRNNAEATAECTVDYARKILDYRLWGIDLDTNETSMLVDFDENEVLIDFAGVSFADAVSFQNGAWYQELLVTNADGAPTYTEDELQDPLFSAADEVASQNAVFSDYTIKDNMIFSNDATDEELVADISASCDMNEEVQDILSDYLLTMWQPALPLLSLEDIFEQGFNVIGSNLASVLFYDIDSTLRSYLKNHRDSYYSDFMTDLVTWLNANPNTPVWTVSLTITGKYSTFEKMFAVRYDPETVQMPVFSVSLDNSNHVF